MQELENSESIKKIAREDCFIFGIHKKLGEQLNKSE